MATLRRRRGVSLRRFAHLAGVSHDTLGAWERGARLPRLPELEAALTALNVDAAERLRLIALVPAPRALGHVRAAEPDAAGPLPGGGDLLRAMRRRRGLTQVEAARSTGVSQGRLGSWERSEDWPTAERLHALCFALGAHPQEVAALTDGRGALLVQDEDGAAEAWSGRNRAVSPSDPLGLMIGRVYFQADALRDLRMLSLERALRLRAQGDEALRSHLHDLYAYRTRALMEESRFDEVSAYADRTGELARQGYGRSGFWAWSVIASAKALRQDTSGRRPRPAAAAALLVSLTPQARSRENQAWMLCELSLALAEAGRADEALRTCFQAREMAEQDALPQEVSYRRRDHAALLAMLGRHGEALDTLETAASLWHYGTDPVVRHHLLAATCHLGLGNAGAAQDALMLALSVIEWQSEHGNGHLARLRPQAEALAARL